MPNNIRRKFEEDLKTSQPFHHYWITIDDNIMSIEFLSTEGEDKIYQFKIEKMKKDERN